MSNFCSVGVSGVITAPLILSRAGRGAVCAIAAVEGKKGKRTGRGTRFSKPPFLEVWDERSCGYGFSSMTSVDLMIAETVSPTLSFISSALRRVITLSIKFSPTSTTT